MELAIILGLLAVVAFFTNIRLVAVCVLLFIAGGWLYQQLPTDQQKYWKGNYEEVLYRSKRAWDAFWF